MPSIWNSRSARCALGTRSAKLAADGAWTITGDPTEAALLVAGMKAQIDPSTERECAPRLHELAFESRRKRMSTVHQIEGQQIAFVKGAPKEVLALCKAIRIHGVDYEGIKMDWVEGKTLKAFVDHRVRDTEALLYVAAEFRKMAELLHRHGLAHGDLGRSLLTKNALADGRLARPLDEALDRTCSKRHLVSWSRNAGDKRFARLGAWLAAEAGA